MTHDQPTPEKAVDFKSASLDTVRLVLQNAPMADILEQLEQHLQQSGGFFASEPVVIDASAVTVALDWARLKKTLRAHDLFPIGIIPNTAHTAGLQQAQLPIVSLSRPGTGTPAQAEKATRPTKQSKKTQIEPPQPAAQQAVQGQRPTKIIERQLRSGQRIYAQNSDLVVIGVVGQGAEIIADGNIHVYGPLRGRAMAGASGNTEARIFTTELDPELIAIAGVYKVIEQTLPGAQHKQAALIYLEGENLNIESIR